MPFLFLAQTSVSVLFIKWYDKYDCTNMNSLNRKYYRIIHFQKHQKQTNHESKSVSDKAGILNLFISRNANKLCHLDKVLTVYYQRAEVLYHYYPQETYVNNEVVILIITRYQITAQKHIKITTAFHRTSIMQSSDNYNLTPICLMPRPDMGHRKLLLEPRDHEEISSNTACVYDYDLPTSQVSPQESPFQTHNTHDTYT